MDPQEIFLIIFIVSSIFLVLDFLIFKTHQKLENFENITIKQITDNNKNNKNNNKNNNNKNNNNNNKNNNNNNKNNNKKKINDISFLNDINNENLTIKDFYPTDMHQTNSKEILKFAIEMDLFHNIIPKFGGGYLGTIWFDDRINGLYECNSLKNKDWKLVENQIPEGMRRPVFITYDIDQKLLCIFEDLTDNVKRYHLYKKKEFDINSEWLFVEKSKIKSIIYNKDQQLLGIDLNGDLYKKENKLLSSKWVNIANSENHIPVRKLLFDISDGYLFGISKDFQLIRKKNLDWENSDWDTYTLPKSLTGIIRDVWYDFDGKLLGLSRIGLVKKESDNYLSKFIEYQDDVKQKEVSIYDVLYGSTGIQTFASMNNKGNNTNNVYVEGKKISEYKFKDPKLNDYLKMRMNLKKKCRKMKSMKLKNLENETKEESQLRNQKFINILGEQKDVIDNLYETISKLKDSHY